MRRGAALLLSGVLCFAMLLCPQVFFAWVYDGASIRVRSDEPIPETPVSPAAVRIGW